VLKRSQYLSLGYVDFARSSLVKNIFCTLFHHIFHTDDCSTSSFYGACAKASADSWMKFYVAYLVFALSFHSVFVENCFLVKQIRGCQVW